MKKLLCSFIILSSPLFADVLRLDDSLKHKYIKDYVQYYIDETGVKKENEILLIPEKQWKSFEKDMGFGKDRRHYWLRFSTDSKSNNMFFLHIDYLPLTFAELYVMENTSLLFLKKITKSNTIATSELIFPLESEGGTRTYFAHVYSESSSLYIPMVIWEHGELILHFKKEILVRGIFNGILLFAVCYTLFLFFFNREKEYLYYAGYHTMILFALVLRDISSARIPYSKFSHIMILIASVFVLNFIRHFLNLKKNFILGERIFHIFKIINLGVAVFLFLELYHLPTFLNISIIQIYLPFVIFYVIGSAVYLSLKKNRDAIFFILAWLPLYIYIFTRILLVNGLLTQEFNNFRIMYYSITLEALVISFALALRIRDINNSKLRTEQATAEIRRKAILDLEQAHKIKDEFISKISHELRTPLLGIMGEAENNITDENRMDMELIIASAKKLTWLVDDILDTTKNLKEKKWIEETNFNLREVVEEVFSIHYYLLRTDFVQLENQIPDSIVVYADRRRVEQILQNLISNAIRFTSRGKISVRCTIKKDRVFISVKDSGKGISKEFLPDIFNEFKQEDNYSEGSGIGLSNCKKITELHGGTISVISATGKGSEFTFDLPLGKKKQKLHFPQIVKSHAEKTTLAFGQLLNPGNPLVVVVDDDILNCKVMSKLLVKNNYSAIIFRTGEEFLDGLEGLDFKPDLVLLDFRLPGISGKDVLVKIRNKYSANDLPVIVLSAMNQINDLTDALNLGASDYLLKPMENSEVLSRISERMKAAESFREAQKLEIKNKSASRQERERIFADLHDHLGGKFTDLKILANQLDDVSPNLDIVAEFGLAVKQASELLRKRIQGLEDMQMLKDRFFSGFKILATRRYSNSGRSFLFSYDSQSEKSIHAMDLAEDLFPVFNEIINNDLKYGVGKSAWEISQSGKEIKILFRSNSKYSLSHNKTGRGTGNIKNRVENMGGYSRISIKDSVFTMEIILAEKTAVI